MTISKVKLPERKSVLAIPGQPVISISVKSTWTPEGALWVASNSLGEPRVTTKGFRSPEEALENELQEIACLLS